MVFFGSVFYLADFRDDAVLDRDIGHAPRRPVPSTTVPFLISKSMT